MNPYPYLSKLCSALSYIYAIKCGLPISVLEMFLYSDILIGAFATLYSGVVYKVKKINTIKTIFKKSDIFTLLLLLISILSSVIKSFLLNTFLPSEISFFDLLVPIGAFIFSLFFFKTEKLQKKHIIAFVICFIGITLYTLSKERVDFVLKIPLILYFISKSLSEVGERRLFRQKTIHEAFSIDNIIYALVGVVILFFFSGREIGNIQLKHFDFRYIFSYQVFIVFILSTLAHFFKILSHRKEKLMTGILIKNISSIFINVGLTYLFFNKMITPFQFLSIGIVMMGLWVFKGR